MHDNDGDDVQEEEPLTTGACASQGGSEAGSAAGSDQGSWVSAQGGGQTDGQGAAMPGSPSRAAAKFAPRPAVPKSAADALRAAKARAAFNVDDEALDVEYANPVQAHDFADRDRTVATGAAAKSLMQAANIGGGGFRIPKKVNKANLPKLEVVSGTPSLRAHQPRCAANPALLASHARIALC